MNFGSINTGYTSQMVYQMRSAAQMGDDEVKESKTQQISQTKTDSARPVAGLSINAEEKGETHANNAAIKMAAASGALSMPQAPATSPVISSNKKMAASARPDNQESQNQVAIKKLANYQSLNQFSKVDQSVLAGCFDQKA